MLQGISKKELKRLYGEIDRYLIIDGDLLTHDEVIERLLVANEKNPNETLDFFDDGITVWEKIEYSFTVGEFCTHIGLTN